jgi:FkbM family methyltransferase
MSLVDGKVSAARRLRTALAMVFCLKNWHRVALGWLRAHPAPLIFRSGLILEGGEGEDALQGFDSVFRDRAYRRFVAEPLSGHLIDIGANIGTLSLDWLQRRPKVTVHAYEPNPRTFLALQKNVRLNGFAVRVHLHNEAVWSGEGTLTLHRDRASSVATTAFPDREAVGDPFVVETVGLDEVIGRCPADQRIKLLKIDTEGAEAEILEGAAPGTLARIDQCILEYHDFRVPGALARCRKMLESNGFRCVVQSIGALHGMLYAVRNSGPAAR